MASKKIAPAKSPAAAKNSAPKMPPTKKTSAAQPVVAAKAKKATAAKPPADYRWHAIQKLASEFKDKALRELVEQVCLDLSREAHALLVARTEDGIDYRKFLASVSQASEELANAAAGGDPDKIDDGVAMVSDELDGSPVLPNLDKYFKSHGADVYRVMQRHLRYEEVNLAFMLR